MKILQGRQALYKKALNYKATLKCPLFHIKANLVFQADAYTVKKVWLSLLFFLKKTYICCLFCIHESQECYKYLISFCVPELLQLFSA